MQVFNNTPDETVFYRVALLREPVSAAIVMIQPTLFTYGFQGPPKPMLLDASALKHDHILLLDTWFMVIIHCGSQVASVSGTAMAAGDAPSHARHTAAGASLVDASLLQTRNMPCPACVCHGHPPWFVVPGAHAVAHGRVSRPARAPRFPAAPGSAHGGRAAASRGEGGAACCGPHLRAQRLEPSAGPVWA